MIYDYCNFLLLSRSLLLLINLILKLHLWHVQENNGKGNRVHILTKLVEKYFQYFYNFLLYKKTVTTIYSSYSFYANRLFSRIDFTVCHILKLIRSVGFR